MPQHSDLQLQSAKKLVLDYCNKFDAASTSQLESTLRNFTQESYQWRGVYPFHRLHGEKSVVELFWIPLRKAFSALQRRPDVFLAGFNDLTHATQQDNHKTDAWVCQMGHFIGLFDQPWLDIPPTHRMAHIRYAEFHQVQEGRLVQSAFFLDLISLMLQAGHFPLPPETGTSFMYPGPRTHDGLLYSGCDPQTGLDTLKLINRMIADLNAANQTARETNDNAVPRELLARTWHEDMIWYGPAGIGATYTIDRYQQQHQYPFRYNLEGKTFNGHVARFAEGNYGCFFGWPNLTNTPSGGFMGLPGSNTPADMRVVDVYRRDGDKLAENWVFIDLPHWLHMQGLDVLGRMRQLLGIEHY